MNQPGTGPAPVIAPEGVSPPSGAVRAPQDVSVQFFPGESHALAGENGAGGSTLARTLAGAHRPDTGRVLPGGAPVDLHGPPAVFGGKNTDESDF